MTYTRTGQPWTESRAAFGPMPAETLTDGYDANGFSKTGGHVVIDIQGYVTGDSDTVSTQGLYIRLDAGRSLINQNVTAASTTTKTVTTIPVVSADASGITTAVRFAPTTAGHLKIYPTGANPVPTTSNINGSAGRVVSGHAFSAISSTDQISVYSHEAANVKLWVTGYFTTNLTPTNPQTAYEPKTTTWDTEQRVATSVSSTNQTTSYSYDPNGQRVAQKLPDNTTIYYVGDIEATRNSTGTWTDVKRVYTHAGAAVASRQTTATSDVTSYLLGNHQGSITTTVTGTTATTRYYTPYGAPRGPQPAIPPTTTGFLGQHEDTTTLTYLNNRYHDPQLGMFVSVDPLVTTTGEPYIYAGGNPTTYSDPTGLIYEDPDNSYTKEVAGYALAVHRWQKQGYASQSVYNHRDNGWGYATAIIDPRSGLVVAVESVFDNAIGQTRFASAGIPVRASEVCGFDGCGPDDPLGDFVDDVLGGLSQIVDPLTCGLKGINPVSGRVGSCTPDQTERRGDYQEAGEAVCQASRTPIVGSVIPEADLGSVGWAGVGFVVSDAIKQSANAGSAIAAAGSGVLGDANAVATVVDATCRWGTP